MAKCMITGKAQYATRELAERMIRRIWDDNDAARVNRPEPVRAYGDCRCGQWELTNVQNGREDVLRPASRPKIGRVVGKTLSAERSAHVAPVAVPAKSPAEIARIRRANGL